jgi:hypothetical protein
MAVLVAAAPVNVSCKAAQGYSLLGILSNVRLTNGSVTRWSKSTRSGGLRNPAYADFMEGDTQYKFLNPSALFVLPHAEPPGPPEEAPVTAPQCWIGFVTNTERAVNDTNASEMLEALEQLQYA